PLLARITVRAAHPRVSLYLSRLLGFHLLRASAPPSSSSLVQASPEFALQSGSSPFAAPAGGENPAPPLSRGAGVVSAMPGTRASVILSTAQVAGGPPLFPSASAGSPTGLTPQNFYRMTT
ncbi:adaptin n terminal region domain-containing protein, partial [Toxoplasma gondii RUB]